MTRSSAETRSELVMLDTGEVIRWANHSTRRCQLRWRWQRCSLHWYLSLIVQCNPPQSCTTLDPTRGLGQVGSENFYTLAGPGRIMLYRKPFSQRTFFLYIGLHAAKF